MTIQMIQATRMTVSPLNVRKTAGGSLDSLKADIAARGVLQNLIAIPAKKKGHFEVTAGGRRLLAVQALIAENTLPKTSEIPVLLLDSSDLASESSLAENFQRAAMNPADECIAFRHFIETEGATVEDVARRFGVETRFVLGRIRLATLAEPIFEALRNGDISLDLAKAYASTDDQDRQRRFWEAASKNYYGNTPANVRSELARSALSATSKTAQFVGQEAYVAAGGRLEIDLFGADEDALWIDVDLAETLATEKIESFGAQEAEKLGVSHTRTIENPYSFRYEEKLVPWNGKREMTPDETAEYQRILARLEDIGEAEDDEAAEEERALNRELDSFEESLVAPIPEDLKGQAVAVVYIDRDGSPKSAGVYFPQGATTQTEDGSGPEGEHGDGAGKSDVSEKLRLDLAADRTEILQLHLASDPGFTIDLAAYLIANQVVERRSYRAGFTLQARRDWMRGPQSPANLPVCGELVALQAALDVSWTKVAGPARFDAFRALGEAERAAWLAFGVAQGIDRHAQGECALQDHIGKLLEIDSSRFWRPTAENYFGRVSKATILSALEEVGGKELSNRYAQAKKGDLATAAERIFGGKAIIEPETAERASKWVPAIMRLDGATPDDGMDGVDDTEDGDNATNPDDAVDEANDSPDDEEERQFA